MRRHFFSLLLIFGIVFWLTHALIRPGWFASHDGIYHIRRVGEMVEMLKAGYFPVRWGLALDNHYGIPLFNYVYPGPYYLASFFALLSPLGTPTILKILAIISFGGGAMAWYYLYQSRSRLWGLTAAILYLTTPYHLVNLFVRFSLGEIMVLGILPWVLVMYHHLASRNRLFWYAPLPLFFALISHNFLGLIGMAIILFYAYFSLPHFSLLLKSTLVSLILSAFFLLPMFAERGLILSGATNDFSFRYSDHFIYFRQLLYSRWDYWYSMPGIGQDGMTFQLGFTSIVVVLLSSLILFRRPHKTGISLLFLYLFTLCLILPVSRFLWDALPLLQVIQFPWRLLGVLGLLTPLFIPYLKSTIPLFLFLLALGLLNVRNYRLPMKFWDSTEFATQYALIQDKTTTSLRQELVPRDSKVERWQNSLVTAPVDFQLDPASSQGKIIFTAESSGTESATVHKNYFPSWQGRVDQQEISLTPTIDGSISVALLPGLHHYQIELGSTRIESLGNLISLVSLGILFILKLRHVR